MGREEMFNVVKSHMHEIIEGVNGQEILETNQMRDFGANSLEIVEVVSKSMRELRIRVPRPKLIEAQNLNDLLDLFEEAAARK